MDEKETTFQLLGRLDSKNVSEIEKELEEILNSTDILIVDLNKLETLDISGIFMLFILRKRAYVKAKKVIYLLNSSKIITEKIPGINIPKIF